MFDFLFNDDLICFHNQRQDSIFKTIVNEIIIRDIC